MASLKQRKKTVLFNDTDKPATTQVEEIKNVPVPTITRPWLTIPYHNIVVLIFMFSLGLTTSVRGTLVRGLFLLVPLQIVHNYLILINTVYSRRKSSDNVVLLVFGAIVVSLIASVPLYATTVLVGAPILAYTPETVLFAVHLSLLILDPLLVEFKFDFARLRAIFGTNASVRMLLSNQVVALSICGLVGAWMGVLPIPLDWDRPWQAWPVTLIAGTYVGTFVGGVISLAC